MRAWVWVTLAALATSAATTSRAQVMIDMPRPAVGEAAGPPAPGHVDTGNVALARYAAARKGPRTVYAGPRHPYGYASYGGYYGSGFLYSPWGFGWWGFHHGHHHHHGLSVLSFGGK